MENTTTSHSSCISQRAAEEEATASMSAGESSWAMHFAGFLASSSAPHSNQEQVDRQGGALSDSSFSSGFSSSFDSLGDEDDDDSFITSDLMCEDDDDDSLQDTACSSAAGPQQKALSYFYAVNILLRCWHLPRN